MNDEEILVNIRKNREIGLSMLMDRYGGLFHHMATNMGVKASQDIEECISDILFEIWKKRHRFDSEKASFRTWIVWMARCCLIDHIRRMKRQKKEIPMDMSQFLFQPSKSYDLDSILHILRKLPEPENQIFYGRYILGESVDAIAKKTEMSVDAVYKRLQRGRKTVKTEFAKNGVDVDGLG